MSRINPQHAPQPPQTDPEIFKHGTAVWLVSGPRSQTTEEWVQGLARTTGLRMDWRQVGGRAVVLVLGDRRDCERGRDACRHGMEALRDQYMACTYNWLSEPDRYHVQGAPIDIEADPGAKP